MQTRQNAREKISSKLNWERFVMVKSKINFLHFDEIGNVEKLVSKTGYVELK